jgi:hypothetical protein
VAIACYVGMANRSPLAVSIGPPVDYESRDMRALVGGETLVDMNRFDWRVNEILAEANTDRFYLVLQASDGGDVQRGVDKPRLLWNAQMSVRSAGTSMVDALPTMATAGFAYFGRETKFPEQVIKPLGNTEVLFGDPTFEGFVEPAAK